MNRKGILNRQIAGVMILLVVGTLPFVLAAEHLLSRLIFIYETNRRVCSMPTILSIRCPWITEPIPLLRR